VQGLEAGAGDYLAKPFAGSELRARVAALGRRGPMLRHRTGTLGAVGGGFEGRRGRIDGRALPRPANGAALVALPASRRGRVVVRDALIESVWGEVSESAQASLEVLIARVRRKLGAHASVLQTVRGVGYAFEWDDVGPSR